MFNARLTGMVISRRREREREGEGVGEQSPGHNFQYHNNHFPGSMATSQCALQIGRGTNFSYFQGFMDDVSSLFYSLVVSERERERESVCVLCVRMRTCAQSFPSCHFLFLNFFPSSFFSSLFLF